jgi:hypothetical protein
MSKQAVVIAAFAGGIIVAVLGFLGADYLGADGSDEDVVDAQIVSWEVRQASDGNPLATVRGAEMTLWVGCAYGAAPGVVLRLHNGIFANGDVSVRWDDGTPVDYLFRKTDDSTLGLLVGRTDFLGRLRRHDAILVGAERSPGQPVREMFSLQSAADALAALPCPQ